MRGRHAPPGRGWGAPAGWLQAVLGLSAAYGGAGLLLGLPGFALPEEDLQPLGLHSWVLPGLGLLAVVAAPMLLGAWAWLRRWSGAQHLAEVCCVLLLGWLCLQLLVIGFTEPVQWLTLALALALTAVTVLGHRAVHP